MNLVLTSPFPFFYILLNRQRDELPELSQGKYRRRLFVGSDREKGWVTQLRKYVSFTFSSELSLLTRLRYPSPLFIRVFLVMTFRGFSQTVTISLLLLVPLSSQSEYGVGDREFENSEFLPSKVEILVFGIREVFR